MTVSRTVTIYTDYKSSYAYLAKDHAYELEHDFSVHLEWLPYILDIPGYLGSARIGADGKIVEETATRINGAVSATATWIADVRRTNVVW